MCCISCLIRNDNSRHRRKPPCQVPPRGGFFCDEKYLPYAALAIHTLVRNNPVRDFDICITSLDALELPPALEGHDVRLCQIEVGDAFDGMPVNERFTVAAYLRIALPEAFEDEYARILYLDCDVLVVGEALGEVFALDLGNSSVGAVMDISKLKKPRRLTKDQKLTGMTGSYFNSGVLLLDVNAFVGEGVRDKCVLTAQNDPTALFYFDQTLLNVVLQGRWAELHPAWNWQWTIVRPFFELFVDTQIVHLVSKPKPWSDASGVLPIRYRETVRRFFARYYPDLPLTTASPATRLEKKNVVIRLIKHITRSFTFVNGYNRHGGDIMKVVLPDRP
ncbi:glycosyltransferase family 8 protein [Yoonia sp.]|uniref:glycosyltransferase family 8 protein n=1 Tax=Yoonia sp. TaxID=2212373 RepID=UPI003A4D7F3D